jgi:hypothetical protein
MLKYPVQHEGTTEMVFCLVKYEIGEFIHSKMKARDGGGWQKLNGAPAVPLADKEKAINELEIRLRKNYLTYCDPLIPLHFLTLAMARALLWILRLAAHHPRQHRDRGAGLSQAEKDATFASCVEMFETGILLQSSKIAPQFRWHVVIHLPLDSFVYFLCELRRRTEGGLVDRAWYVVGEIFEKYPELSAGTGNSLFDAIGSLTLTAWEAREVALASSVREREEHVLSNQLPPDLNSMDWGDWNDWLQGNDFYGTDESGYLFR